MAEPTFNPSVSLDKPIAMSLDGSAPNKEVASTPVSRQKLVYQKYNELFHELELYINTSGKISELDKSVENSKYIFHINPAAVLNLSIVETFNGWVTEGSIIFMYLPDDAPDKATGGQPKDTVTKGAIENGQALKGCQFRADGFDMLRLRISPTKKKQTKTGTPKNGLELDFKDNDPKWCLSYLFSIYDIEDVTENIPEINANSSTYMKCLKVFFRDIRYQVLNTTNIEYSTTVNTDVAATNTNSGLYNEGVKFTGDAMQDVIKAVIDNTDIFDTTSSGPNELFPSPLQDPNVTWDKGGSEIFYTSPAGYSAYDDLDYIYSHHIGSKPLPNSSVHDLCILHTERCKKWGGIEPICLTPLSDFFEKSTEGDKPGELQLEHFFVTAMTTERATLTYNAPMSEAGDRDLKTAKYGQIINYSFVDMSPEINSSKFCTTPVYSVDIKNRTFNVEFQDNDVATARKLLTEAYISKLYTASKNEPNEKLFLPTIHQSKKTWNVFPTFSLNGDNKIARQRNGIQQLLYTGLFLNACVCFSTLGLTLRNPGTFIAIDRMSGSLDNDYANKLYGQWLVVKVDHIFESGTYINNIYAIKMHRHNNPKNGFPESI